jgi:hypothetical protein
MVHEALVIILFFLRARSLHCQSVNKHCKTLYISHCTQLLPDSWEGIRKRVDFI